MSAHHILLVEDNPDDVELTRLAFAEAGGAHRLHAVGDGAEALDYLLARGRHADRDGADLPALVLLDLNLPRLDGREVLQAIRADPATQGPAGGGAHDQRGTARRRPGRMRSARTATSRSRSNSSASSRRCARSAVYWLELNLAPGRG
jgi:CheY-like chemotaxis protein